MFQILSDILIEASTLLEKLREQDPVHRRYLHRCQHLNSSSLLSFTDTSVNTQDSYSVIPLLK